MERHSESKLHPRQRFCSEVVECGIHNETLDAPVLSNTACSSDSITDKMLLKSIVNDIHYTRHYIASLN